MGEGAQLFGGLGDFHCPISTISQPVQAYFDQGMRLLWAFNHDEATRSFAKAVELARRHRPESAQRRFSSLAHTLRMQGRAADAMAAQQEFGAAWQNADVVLTASAF